VVYSHQLGKAGSIVICRSPDRNGLLCPIDPALFAVTGAAGKCPAAAAHRRRRAKLREGVDPRAVIAHVKEQIRVADPVIGSEIARRLMKELHRRLQAAERMTFAERLRQLARRR
jgi:hypothetical protein